jgi:hypothetical protein
MRGLALLFSVLAGLGALTGAAYADASGKALGVDPDAKSETKAGVKELVVGADIFLGDKVVTDAKGLVEIKFSDNTKLVVGPNSALVIEDYLLRDDGSNGKLAINALSGTFRFVTGGAAKDRYLIKTPTGTIGVRGTGFDLTDDARHFSVMLYHGAVDICNKAKKCITLDDVCEIGMADLSDAVILGNGREMNNQDREAMRGMFPYSVNESPLQGQFRIAQARECLNRQVVPTEQEKDDTPSRPQQRGRFTNGFSSN